MQPRHIHTPEDGRGQRIIYVNGKRLNKVLYADTKRGIVDHFDDPPKVDKHGKRLITRRKRGNVRVEVME